MDKLQVQKIAPHSMLPTAAYPGDSGLDLYSAEDLILSPFERRAVRTGIRIALPVGTEGQIRGRSGLALENGISVLNSPGTIDTGYRGEILVILINFDAKAFQIKIGMRIAQLVVCPVISTEVEEASTLPPGGRGSSGFGSSGH